ncbi:MAG: XRE family transcriptional regulator [Clostridia bacterium]|nr:XRE family transcriptional regulator [Clostridia bacterium]
MQGGGMEIFMIGEKIRSLRKEASLSQTQLASLLSVSQSTVSMWEKNNNSPEYSTLLKLCDVFGVSSDALTGTTNDKVLTRVPVLGYVRAGIPNEALENILDYEDVYLRQNDPDEYFALRIKGDSMSPRMMDGDIVTVRRTSDFQSGDVCVVLVENSDATVKKVIKKDMGILLMPFNPAYDPLVFTVDEVQKKPVTILGKVTELRAKI